MSGLGIADQRQRIEAYCAMRGMALVRVIEDNACSGGKPLADRSGGAKLLRALKRREAQAVVVLKLDRGFRSTVDCLATVERWERTGISLHIVDFGGSSLDTASATGKLFLTLIAGMAEWERNTIRERTRAALAVKRRRGERISRYAPFGYSLTDDGTLQPELDEQRAVRRVRKLRGAGKSLRQIAADLASHGMFGRSGQPLSAKTVRAILLREAA